MELFQKKRNIPKIKIRMLLKKDLFLKGGVLKKNDFVPKKKLFVPKKKLSVYLCLLFPNLIDMGIIK